MDQAKLETIYDAIASAINDVGPDKTELFLAKLALSLASEFDDVQIPLDKIAICSQDL